MRRLTGSPMLVIFGWTVVGLLIGHVASYDLVYPDGHVHAQVLAESGHQWLWLLEPSVLLGFLVAVTAGLVGGRTRGGRGVRFRVLATIQVSAFLGIEIAERLVNGVPPADIGHQLFDHGLWLVFAIGVGAQLLTAWLASAASRFIAEVARAEQRQRTSRPRSARRLVAVASRPFGTPTVRANGSRAPPRSLRPA